MIGIDPESGEREYVNEEEGDESARDRMTDKEEKQKKTRKGAGNVRKRTAAKG